MPAEKGPSRRSFFGVLVASVSAVVGAMMSIPVLRFLVYPAFRSRGESEWSTVGDIGQFSGAGPFRAEVEVRRVDGWRASTVKRTVWLVRNSQNQLVAVSDVCPHLGCSVPWRDDEQMFHCPCHHAKFRRSGDLIEGPSPRSLDPLPIKVEDGKLWVKYQVFRNLVATREVIG
jgi:Rieske Fe-S protein